MNMWMYNLLSLCSRTVFKTQLKPHESGVMFSFVTSCKDDLNSTNNWICSCEL